MEGRARLKAKERTMENSDIQRVQQSFGWVFVKHHDLTDAFYESLFTKEPKARALFKGDKRAQQKMMLSVLSMIVNGLDDIEKLRPSLVKLGAGHARLGVHQGFYDSWGETFTQTLLETLHCEKDRDLANAWTQAFDMVSTIMIKAAEDVAGKRITLH